MISTIKALTRNRKMQYLPTCNRFPWQQISGTLPVLQQGHKLEGAKHFQKINRICKDPELTGHDYYLSKAKCRIANYDIPMWPLFQSANNARAAFKGSLHFHIFTWMFHPTHPTLCLPDPLSFMFHGAPTSALHFHVSGAQWHSPFSYVRRRRIHPCNLQKLSILQPTNKNVSY